MMDSQARFERLIAVERVGPEGVARLQRARVAVLGVGAIGVWIAQQLVDVCGNVVLVDRGLVEPVNVGAQGFQEIDEGLPKVAARARALRPRNRSCKIETVHADIRRLGFGALGELDLVFVALDSRSARVIASQLALRGSYSAIDCAVDGSGRSLVARVAAYGPGGACYVCPRDAGDLADIMREGGAGCPVWSWGQAGEAGAPTLSIPSLGAAVAGIAVTWGLRMLLTGAADVADRELLMDLDRDTFSVRKLRRNPLCLANHRPFSLVPAARGTVERTLREAAGPVGEPVVLELQRRGVACAIRCPDCLQERRPYKLLDAISPLEGTCGCGGVMQPVAGLVLDAFGLEQAEPFLSCTWDRLGLPAADVVVARGPKGEVDLCLM
jgi:molybdopterin/thiamine biosynthesis adenylyltransferase